MGKTHKHFEREGSKKDRRSDRHRINSILSHIDIQDIDDEEIDLLHQDSYDSVKVIERVDRRTSHRRKDKWDEDPE